MDAKRFFDRSVGAGTLYVGCLVLTPLLLSEHFLPVPLSLLLAIRSCRHLFPEAQFEALYADLVALVPDIDKQKRLVEVYDNNRMRGGVVSVSQGGRKANILVKPVC